MKLTTALIAGIFSALAFVFLMTNGVVISDSTVIQIVALPFLVVFLLYKFSVPSWVMLFATLLASGSFYYHFACHWKRAEIIVPPFAVTAGDSKAALFREAMKSQSKKIDRSKEILVRGYPFATIPEQQSFTVISGTPRWLTIKPPKSEPFVLPNGLYALSDATEVGLMLDKDGATIKFLSLMFIARKERNQIRKKELLVKAIRNQGRWSSQTHRAWPLFLLANEYVRQSDGLDKAIEYYKRALKLFPKKNRSRLKFDVINNFAVAQYYKGVSTGNHRLRKSGMNRIRKAQGMLPKSERKGSIFKKNLGKIRDES